VEAVFGSQKCLQLIFFIMSRRRGEFEHRTSIFEGAFRAWSYLGGLDPEDLESKSHAEVDPPTNPIVRIFEGALRAWSHLGGLDPEDLETKSPLEVDPLTNPIVSDPRLSSKGGATNPDGSSRREYPYEPLPRSGLAHPYVQAILSPWLGPDADNEAIQLGLATLRAWWQHRHRRGESGSAIAALGTEKMKEVVEGYTRHFFTLAHCLVVNDKVEPPRSLHVKMKELEKQGRISDDNCALARSLHVKMRELEKQSRISADNCALVESPGLTTGILAPGLTSSWSGCCLAFLAAVVRAVFILLVIVLFRCCCKLTMK
jgi:hypothetical protein